jgi:hypothetical protein
MAVPAKRKGASVHASQNSVFIVIKIRTIMRTKENGDITTLMGGYSP